MEAAQVVRDDKGRVTKGSKLSPFGSMPRKQILALKKLEGLTGKAIARLEQLLEDKNGSVALGAAKEILDRNLGKVKQQVTVDVTSTHVLHLQALEELAARKKQQIIEAQAIDITEHATLDRIVSHGDSDASVTIEGIATPIASERAEQGAPPSSEDPGAAAYAPTPPYSHQK